MSKYRVETTGGVYEIETESGVSPKSSTPPKQSIYDLISNASPLAAAARVAGGGFGELIKKQPLQTSNVTMKQSPTLGAIQKTGEDLVTIPSRFFNSMALNAPKSLMNTYTNVEFPKTDNTAANVAGTVSDIAGLIKSPVSKVLGNAVKSGQYGKTAITGAIEGGLYSPDENFRDLKSRGVQAALGGVIGPAVIGATGLGKNAYKFAIESIDNFKNAKFLSNQDYLQLSKKIGKDVQEVWDGLKAEKNQILQTNGSKQVLGKPLIDLKDTVSTVKSNIFDDLVPSDKATLVKIESAINSPDLSAGQLESLRQDLWSIRSNSYNSKVNNELKLFYNNMKDIASLDDYLGKEYKSYLSRTSSLIEDVQPYMEKFTKNFNKDFTGKKIKSLKELQLEESKAFNLLSKLSSTPNRANEIESAIKGQKIIKTGKKVGKEVAKAAGLGVLFKAVS